MSGIKKYKFVVKGLPAYIFTFKEYQACCFWFIPKKTCKHFTTETVCDEIDCPILKERGEQK